MNRNTLIALVVFALLGVAYVATRETQVNVGVRKLNFAPVAADAISSIELGSTKLELQSGKWSVAGKDGIAYVADENLVKQLQQALAEVKASDFVTEKTEKHAELEIDEAKGIAVKARVGTTVVRDLIIGKASKSGGNYLREAKSNEVFVTNGPLSYQVKRDVDGFRKRTIATAKPDDVNKVKVSSPSGSYVLASEGTGWKLETEAAKDYRFDAAAAQRVVGAATSLNAQSFLATEPPEPFDHVVALEKKDGTSVTLKLTAKRADGNHALHVEGDPQVYVLGSWQAEQLLKDVEGLRDTRLARFEAAQVERISLNAGGKKVIAVREGEAWKVTEPKTLPAGFDFDPGQGNAILGRWAALRGTHVVRDTPDAKAGLTDTVELTIKGGAPVRFAFGSTIAGGTEVYAKGDDGLIYAANAADKTSLETGLELFKRPPPPPQFNGGGINGLDQLPPEIRAQLEAQLRQQRP